MNKRLVGLSGIVALGLLSTVCVGQNQVVPAEGPAAGPQAAPGGLSTGVTGSSSSGDTGGESIRFGVRTAVKKALRDVHRRDIRRLTDELRDASDEKKKAEITKQLESVVGDIFDGDLKVREAELAKLEARLKKLHEQLDRRRQARGEIIQLEVKVLINEAAGLGFSSEKRFGDRRRGLFEAAPTSSFSRPAPSNE